MPRRFRPAPVTLHLLLMGLALAALLWAPGCERSSAPQGGQAGSGSATAQEGGERFARPADAQDSGRPVILMLGDSLTAGHGLPKEQAYPALIQERLAEEGYPHRVVNAGVSGDTSAGGLARLDWLLRQRVDIMVLALGANDGLRGQDPAAMRANLAEIIERARAEDIRVVLAGMRMPANYGLDYTRRYAAVFPALAERYDLPFVPFLLEGVAMRSELNQGDGIHPNAKGQRILADTVWEALEPLLEQG